MKFCLPRPFFRVFLLICWTFCASLFVQAQDSTSAGDTLAAAGNRADGSRDLSTAPLYALDYMETGQHIFSLYSPYETVLSHLYFLKEKSYHPDSAAMTLNIQNPGSADAQDKAIRLKQFLDGAGYFIDIDALPHDPDYVDSTSRQHRFVLIPTVPEIFLYKKGRGWVYSWTTVQAIDKLHARIYPFGTLKWLPKWSQKPFLGMRLWQFLGILLFVVFTYLLHRLLTKLIGTVLKSFLEKAVKRTTALVFFNKVAQPISLLILFVILRAIFPVLQFSLEVNRWVVTGFQVMIPVYATLIALQVINLVMAFWGVKATGTKNSVDDQLVPIVRNLLKGVIVVVAIVFVLNRLQVDITALIGGVAFGTLAFALAAQDTIKNLFGSVVIFLDRPFQIGDWVIIGDSEGIVEEVSIRSTRIRTFANSLISVPNGNIASAAVNNMGARVYRRFVTRLRLHYATPPQLIELYVEGLREVVRNHPTTRKDAFEVHFESMSDDALEVLVYLFFAVPNWSQELEGRQSFLLAALELADRLRINFVFPNQVFVDRLTEDAAEAASNERMAMARRSLRTFVSELPKRNWKEYPKTKDSIVGSEISSDDGHGRN